MISIFIHFCSRWGLYTCSTNTKRKKYTISSYSIWCFVIFLILFELSTSSPQPQSQLRVLLFIALKRHKRFISIFNKSFGRWFRDNKKKMNRLASTNRIWRHLFTRKEKEKKFLIWRRKGPVQWVWRSLVKSLIIQSRSNSLKWSSNLQTHRCRHYNRRRSRNR